VSGAPRRARLRAGGAQAIAHTLRAETDVEGLREGVAATLEDVRARGDDALVEAARRFDCAGFAHERLRVAPAAIERATERLDDDLRAAIVAASAQVRIVAEALLPDDRHVSLPYGQRIQVRRVPVDSAGCYVPGGRAAYPSSLIMGAVARRRPSSRRPGCWASRRSTPPGARRRSGRSRTARPRSPPSRWSSAPGAPGCRRPSARWRARWGSTASPGRARS
jgi:hypothetical protein